MAKLQDCQFIEVNIDGKVVAGSSEEAGYKNWMEGFAPTGLSTSAGPDSTFFYTTNMSILVTKASSELYEQYLKRGYKNIVITTIHRGSDKLNQDYEIQRIVYDNCKLQSLSFGERDKLLFMDVSFDVEESVELTLNVPNTKDDGLDKVGPIKYNIPAKKIV